MSTLAAIILTRNEAAHVQACIDSVRFADLVLVVDSLSADGTQDLARAAGAEVIERPFEDYADQRNAALEAVQARADWVLFVDADERITPELAAEVRSTLGETGYAGWRIPRHNYIFGRLTRGAGWYPDYQTRLLRVGAAHYMPEHRVHERVELDGELGTLNAHIVHYNYTDVRQFLDKQRRYTAYEAQVMVEQGIRPKPQNYILQPLRHFRWRFLTLGGWRDGLHGLRLCLLMSWYEFRKYVLLRRLWQNQQAGQEG